MKVKVGTEGWILCPLCKGKTRIRIRPDTRIENFPLYCPKCKSTILISVENNSVEYYIEPDAKTQCLS